MNVGPLEIALVLLVVLVIFGPKRLPQLGRSLGGGMREFKDAVTGKHKDDDRDALEPGTPAGDNATQASTDDAQRAKAADAS